ncbi:alpha/beta hydrolase [Streptomyces sp. NPDC059740]|uniref:alpha/beta hydrolase n=1 Tax=Streptomyces sp. NPDC059740 TaxID=3346926 RepID=UPI00365AB509
MRPATTAAVAATTVLGAGAAAVAVGGRYAGRLAVRPPNDHPLPGDPRLTVHSVGGDRITLTRTLASLRPGLYGLAGPGCHAVVGPVVRDAVHTPDTVVRRLERVTYGTLTPGARLRMTPQVYVGDPRDAFGYECADAEIAGDLGPLPAWFLPGSRETWMILVHGLATTREHPMVLMPLLHRAHLPVLAPAYRGDPGAPASADGTSHLGAAEWRDVEAAIGHAVRHGARRIVLYGWSTGATMALKAALHTAHPDRVCGLVLDSPVLDWRATVRNLAAARHVPHALLPLAVRAAEGMTGVAADELGELARAAGLDVPTLLFHGPDDTLAPWQASRDLAARHPSRVALQTVPHAPHAAMWNADPEHYEEVLRRFLTPLV